jgi:hypothetical protein
MKLVVARYNEDIEWTKKYDTIIYNKGTPLVGYSNVVELPNVGREGHTYYHHIYTNYDTLDDYTVFLQGNPFDHTPDLHTILENIHDFDGSYKTLCKSVLPCTNINCTFHYNLPMLEVYSKVFGPCTDMKTFLFGAGAQFIVSKACIHKRPKEFYKKIVDLLAYDKSPIEGYVIERYHGLIFS